MIDWIGAAMAYSASIASGFLSSSDLRDDLL
jgi:hypothetical protein